MATVLEAAARHWPCPPRRGAGRVRLSIVIPVYRGERTIGPLVRALVDCLAGRYAPGNRAGQRRQPRQFGRTSAAHLARRLPVRQVPEPVAQFQRAQRRDGGAESCHGRLRRHHGRRFSESARRSRRSWSTRFNTATTSSFRTTRSSSTICCATWAAASTTGSPSLLLDKPRDLYLSSFKVLSRFVVDELVKYDGPYPYIDGLVLRFTRNYSRVLVAHDPRREGRSGYTLRKLVSLYLQHVHQLFDPAAAAGLVRRAGLVGAGTGAGRGYFVVERICESRRCPPAGPR